MVQIFVQASGRNLTFIFNDFLNYKKMDIFNPFPSFTVHCYSSLRKLIQKY